MKSFIKTYTLIFSLMATFYGCQEDEYSFGDIIEPSNISITAEIVGQDTNNPNGDGSGVVNFITTADNAVSYKYVFNGTEAVSTSGAHTISFSQLGLNTYTVNVVVSGTAGVSSSKTIEVQVLSTYSPPSDLTEKLYGSGSKVWKIQSASTSHFGLGPVAGTIQAEWYGASPNEKDGLGMYDDRFTFSSDGTFTHVTNGTIFGRDPHIVNDLGANTSGNVNGADIENYAYGDYTESFTLTAPGGVETLSLSGLGFIGYYTGGNHKYEIFDRSIPNEFVLRTTDAASDFDWWFIIVAE